MVNEWTQQTPDDEIIEKFDLTMAQGIFVNPSREWKTEGKEKEFDYEMATE